ncbi:MAG: glycosyltransferase family A protein [Ferroplasma sp.]|uniref:glycosyltransferase family A protein n=1 Tax=Ferroplasma sp. TaxID=2591003 RepID=UPI0028162484|nr:glycosyltransferase family A protein [Ferroplasma sp.]WMT50615.1 MAG: glycosyltransferase family A protein [Ferroplasma sp.]
MVYSSIIIFDFKRPDFVEKAVNFLIKESSGTDSEIILIKSYKDPKIEKFLDDNNIVYADLLDKNKQSDYIKTACKVASGEILTFMDDDDIFYPGKIKYVSDIFKANKDLGYYHNNFDTIDENGNPKINRNYKTPEFETLYIENKEKASFFKRNKNLKLMLKIRPDFNSSSIAIRKIILSEYQENYDFNVRPDSFIFALSLMSKMDLMLDDKVLTHYRIYSGNVSTSYNATVDKLRETFMEAFSSGISMFDIIKTIVNGSAYENYIELRIINLKLAYNFWSLSRTYKVNLGSKFLALSIDLIHESGYIILSAMPVFIKLKAMKIFYHAK